MALKKSFLCKGRPMNGHLHHDSSPPGLPSVLGSSPQPAFQAAQWVRSCPPTQICTRRKTLSPSQAAGRMHQEEDCLTRMGREPEPQPCSRTALARDPATAEPTSQCRTSARSCPFSSLPWWSLWVPEGTIPAREARNRLASNLTCAVWVVKAALWYWGQRRYQDLMQGPNQSNLPCTLTSCL